MRIIFISKVSKKKEGHVIRVSKKEDDELMKTS